MTLSHRDLNAPAIVTAALALAVLAAACGSDSGSGTSVEVARPTGDGRPVIVDYSPTLSDVPALMYLATHPDIELLAVTLPGTGEADCGPGVRQTRSLLVVADHADVPVGCGSDAPMVGDRKWPAAWTAASNSLTGVVLPGVVPEDPVDAEDLLAAVLEAADDPVTIVTLAPLTNLGRLLRDRPSLVDEIESIVVMGGAVDTSGNVDAAPGAEWNLYIDPESVRAVFESGVPVTLVGLDATNSVPGSPVTYVRLEQSAATDTGEVVRQLWDANFDLITSPGWFFWDELAAVVAVDETVATISERALTVDDDGATLPDDDGVVVRVATSADPEAFEQRFLEVFAGGDLPAPEPVTATAQLYVDDVTEAMTALDSQLTSVFSTMEAAVGVTPELEAMTGFAEGIFAGLEAAHEGLVAAEPPDDLRGRHEELVTAAADILAVEQDFVAAVAANSGPDPVSEDSMWVVFELAAEEAGVTAMFDSFDVACAELELAVIGLGTVADICFDE
jgi:inosine-uridine nucleoside N-ribohydrolase